MTTCQRPIALYRGDSLEMNVMEAKHMLQALKVMSRVDVIHTITKFSTEVKDDGVFWGQGRLLSTFSLCSTKLSCTDTVCMMKARLVEFALLIFDANVSGYFFSMLPRIPTKAYTIGDSVHRHQNQIVHSHSNTKLTLESEIHTSSQCFCNDSIAIFASRAGWCILGGEQQVRNFRRLETSNSGTWARRKFVRRLIEWHEKRHSLHSSDVLTTCVDFAAISAEAFHSLSRNSLRSCSKNLCVTEAITGDQPMNKNIAIDINCFARNVSQFMMCDLNFCCSKNKASSMNAVKLTPAELQSIILGVDANSNGIVEFSEFLEFIRDSSDILNQIRRATGAFAQTPYGFPDLRSAFLKYAKFRFILCLDHVDLKIAVYALGCELNMFEIRRVFGMIDKDGDGYVNYDEFEEVFLSKSQLIKKLRTGIEQLSVFGTHKLEQHFDRKLWSETTSCKFEVLAASKMPCSQIHSDGRGIVLLHVCIDQIGRSEILGISNLLAAVNRYHDNSDNGVQANEMRSGFKARNINSKTILLETAPNSNLNTRYIKNSLGLPSVMRYVTESEHLVRWDSLQKVLSKDLNCLGLSTEEIKKMKE